MDNFSEKFIAKMKSEKLPDIAINNFVYNYRELLSGKELTISGNDIKNPNNIADYNKIEKNYIKVGNENLKKSVMIKLNGGLGTSMGLKKAKSLIKVKNEYSFLDIIAKQSVQSGASLIFMNSFNTRTDTLNELKKFDSLQKQAIDLDFLQSKIPKISKKTGMPAEYIENKFLEWCPPGHGDIYTAMMTSGLLDNLLSKGYEYAFISNSDNLGATLDQSILGYLIAENVPFLMEVAERTESDKKGGHLAQKKDGQLMLREVAQCPVDENDDFQNYKKYTYFNTNNIWVNLNVLADVLKKNDGNMQLPIIKNQKKVNPRNENSEEVIQLETAMGSAIEVFENSEAILVPRNRFLPVKKTSDLLKIQSNLYYLDENNILKTDTPEIAKDLVVELDEEYFKTIDDFQRRLGSAVLDLTECKVIKIKGDVRLSGKYKFVDECLVEC